MTPTNQLDISVEKVQWETMCPVLGSGSEDDKGELGDGFKDFSVILMPVLGGNDQILLINILYRAGKKYKGGNFDQITLTRHLGMRGAPPIQDDMKFLG